MLGGRVQRRGGLRLAGIAVTASVLADPQRKQYAIRARWIGNGVYVKADKLPEPFGKLHPVAVWRPSP